MILDEFIDLSTVLDLESADPDGFRETADEIRNWVPQLEQISRERDLLIPDIVHYARSLYLVSQLRYPDERTEAIRKLTAFQTEHPELQEVAEFLAGALHKQFERMDTAEQPQVLKKMKELEAGYPDSRIIAIYTSMEEEQSLSLNSESETEEYLQSIISRLRKFPFDPDLSLSFLNALNGCLQNRPASGNGRRDISAEELLKLAEEKAPDLDCFGQLAFACGLKAARDLPEESDEGFRKIDELSLIAQNTPSYRSGFDWSAAGMALSFLSTTQQRALKLLSAIPLYEDPELTQARAFAFGLSRLARTNPSMMSPELIRDVEQLLERFDGDQAIAIGLARILSCYRPPHDEGYSDILKRLSGLCEAYPEWEEIAKSFGDRFRQGIKNVDLAILFSYEQQLRDLSDQFPGAMILNSIAQELERLHKNPALNPESGKSQAEKFQTPEQILDYADSLKKKLQENPEDEQTAESLAEALTTLTLLSGIYLIDPYIEELEALHQQFPDNTPILENVARSMTALAKDLEPDEIPALLERLFPLTLEKPESQALMASFLQTVLIVFRFCKTAEDRNTLIDFFRKLALDHPDFGHAAKAWCSALAVQSAYQSPEEREALLKEVEACRIRFPEDNWIETREADLLCDNVIDQMTAPGSKKSRNLSDVEKLLQEQSEITGELPNRIGDRFSALSLESRATLQDSLFQLIRTFRNNEPALAVLAACLSAVVHECSQKARLKILKQIGSLYRSYPDNMMIAQTYCTALAAMAPYQPEKTAQESLLRISDIKSQFQKVNGCQFSFAMFKVVEALIGKTDAKTRQKLMDISKDLLQLALMEQNKYGKNTEDEAVRFNQTISSLL